MRKGSPLCPTVVPRPLVCGGKKRAATLDITTSAESPWKSGTLTRIAYPGILELCHPTRSEEHTSELQSLRHLVCRLLLEKKNKQPHTRPRCPPPLPNTNAPHVERST